ncbi:MAG: VCBS repeat-containing protein [Solirubrobacteraceae bacterium]
MRRALAVGALLVLAIVGMAAAEAQAQPCPAANPSYDGPCGPTFTVPAWGDGGGWTDPSKYSTIQLADINGDGHDELLARNDQGLEVYWFDTTLGQWRPQVDADGVQQVLRDFRSPLPSDEGAPGLTSQGTTNWKQPYYYSTIHTGNVDGDPGDEVYARFADGLHVYKYVPPNGSTSINGGSWQRIAAGGPFSDAVGGDDPSIYSTIHLADLGLAVPVFFGRRRATSADPSPVRYGGLLNGQWGGTDRLESLFQQPLYPFGDAACGTPACYLSIQAANVAPVGTVPDFSTYPPEGTVYGDPNQILLRTAAGVSAWTQGTIGLADGSGLPWFAIGPASTYPNGLGSTDNPGPFADLPSADCPFSAAGASGPGSGDCLGTSPSYYETLQAANVDGRPGDELLARASDGLRVKRWNGGGYDSLATLTALAGAPGSIPPGVWGSIRTGDITGDGKADVLFVDAKGQLEAWTYNPGANQWSELPTSTPLNLGTDFVNNPAYYDTLQVGDVNGDGRADVVARGPFGIRTWFYCSGGASQVPGCASLHGQSGWSRYLPDGYAGFPARQCPVGVTGPCGQQGAFTSLTKLAKSDRVIPQSASSVRDVWTAENAPQPTDLTSLQRGLISIANCTGAVPGNPPSYQACTPPADSAGFTAAEWTAVVNEMLAESYNALQVVNLFAQLDSMRQSLFIAQNAALPAIGGDLGLQAAADSTATFSPQSFFAGATGIAASLAGISQPEISAALWVASELISMLPSASPTAMSTFQTTYAGLQGKFAQIVGETEKALQTQSQTVRQDGGLLSLVGQLRASGTWALDTIGMTSAANQAFAIWVYQTLMPTVYDRYAITDCFTGFRNSGNTCTGVPAGPGVIGGGQNFTTIGQRLDLQAGVPCVQGSVYSECSYTTPPADLMTQIWGPVSDTCTYQPGNAGTAWTFGSCSAGVDPRSSIGANTWDFNSYSGDFDVNGPVRLGAQAAAARDPLPPIVLGRGRIGRRAGKRAFALVSATTVLPRGVRLAGASVRLNRLLFESAGRGELAPPRAGRAARPLKLRRRGGGMFVANAPSHPGVRLALRRSGNHALVTVTLRISASLLRVPQACVALPAAIAPRALPHVELMTELVINDGHIRRLVRLTHRWRCARDARGNIDRLVSERPHRYPARGGLVLTLHGPRRAQPGTPAHYVAVVYNRRTDRRRLRSSLWDVVVDARRGRTLRVHELRRGRDRRLSFFRRLTPRQRGRYCVDVVATAPGAKAVRAQTCTSITNPSPPPIGLG